MIAIRGAIQIEEDTAASIDVAVRALCREILSANRLVPERIVSALFTLTPDLHSAFPALSARGVGWSMVPMICAQELTIEGALPRVARVLLHVRGRGRAHHVYLSGAEVLRPDLAHATTKKKKRTQRSPRGTKR